MLLQSRASHPNLTKRNFTTTSFSTQTTKDSSGRTISANSWKSLRKIRVSNFFINFSMFAEHYVQDELGSNEKVSIGKMFLHQPSKISDRLIYKVTPGTSKISIIAKDYNKKNVPLSREKIILLSYLVNRYLT
jgi:hypothetical protein